MTTEGVRELAEVLAHVAGWPKRGKGAVRLEDAALAWFDARLGSGEVVRAVGVALMNNTIGSPAKGEPFKREDRRTEDVIRDAAAAVEAVRAALKEGE